MTLVSSTLRSDLEQVLSDKPSADEAARRWALAYASYAANAMSAASSMPVNAMGNLSILEGAFSSGFSSQSTAGAAGAITGGVMSFWMALLWTGATASGATIVPGNFSLTAELSSIFSDTAEKSEADKAGELADAFDAGAKLVTVMDVLLAPPNSPIVGPIS